MTSHNADADQGRSCVPGATEENGPTPTTADSALFGAIDVGGTSVKWMVVTTGGRIIDSGAQSSDPAGIHAQILAVCSDVCARHPRLVAFGVSTPGIVDEAAGTILFASNLDLAGVSLAQAITERTGKPARVGHDGRNAGLAEGLMGAGRGAASFMMIPIGTGISAAIFANGAMVAGHEFSAGEIGHAPVIAGGEPCVCGQRGCLEVYASAKGIARRYAARTGRDIGARAIEHALDSDPDARAVWDEAIQAMASSLAGHILTLDPQRLIIGGGLSGAGEVYMEPLRRAVSALLAWRQPPPIVTAELGDVAGQWGAAILACQAAGRSDYEQWQATGV